MSQTKSASTLTELKALAGYLLDRQDTILEKWREAIKQAAGEQPSTLESYSRRKFFDSIPILLRKICKGLVDREESLEEIASEHGTQRWNHGLDLRELVSEWRHLHLILIDCINQAPESITLSIDAVGKAQKKLADHIYIGIRASIDQFYRLQDLQAESQLRDLELIVQQLGDQKIQRGENLQEASHDLKGNMTAIQMNLFLLEKAELSDRARELVNRLSLSTESLTQMLKNLLDLSRLEAGREELNVSEFDVAEAMKGLCDSLQPMADAEGVELRCNGEEPLKVKGDRLKVVRIAQNLLTNSLKYTEEGYAEVTWKINPPDRRQLTIRDTGPGMETTHASPFANTSTDKKMSPQPSETREERTLEDKKLQSEGIGLSIVRHLCHLLEGIIEINSEPDKGTTVEIAFPLDYPNREK